MVYVEWYGKVIEGSVVKENDLFGMTAVRIMVQGMPATALFVPGHVYESAELVPVKISHLQSESVPKIEKAEPVDDVVMKFKTEHWDAEHNHLRIEALDEFYELWKGRSVRRPAGEPVGTGASVERKRMVSDGQMEVIKERLKEVVKPRKRSVVQLSLF